MQNQPPWPSSDTSSPQGGLFDSASGDAVESLRVEIERVSYRNEDNGFSVVRVRTVEAGQQHVVTGNFLAVQPGQHFEIRGVWATHAQYGRQFKMEACHPIQPTDKASIQRYLSSGFVKGIGPKTAEKIVAYFGTQTLEILDLKPERLKEVPTIGRKKALAILASWRAGRAMADVLMFLNRYGISPLFAGKIYRTYGDEAIAVVSEDPYRLAVDIQGIGFISADRIAQNMGLPPLSPERIQAAIRYHLLQGEERGHCFVTFNQLQNELPTSLSVSPEELAPLLPDCLKTLAEAGVIFCEGPDGQHYYSGELLAAECNVAAIAHRLARQRVSCDDTRIDQWLSKFCNASGIQLSEDQLGAVRRAAKSGMFILTGGPGVGKTTTANTLIRLFKAMGKNVALGAPTGRAAQRLSEVAAMPAKTIHRLLEWTPGLGGFAKDESNPITADVVIIDEASMLDIRLADQLFRALPKECHLVLIGDTDQLPSVGPGQVLSDLIASDCVPFHHLSEIFRQASGSQIVEAAHAVNTGKVPEIVLQDGGDCQFVPADTAAEIGERLQHLLLNVIRKEWGFDPVRDVQILTPMNKGDLGTQQLNDELQRLFNPKRPNEAEFKRGNFVLRRGDKVIQSANNYELGVFNGDIGFVTETQIEGGALLVSFGDRLVKYVDEQALDLRLAYAITIHKSQGSEFPVVIVPMSMQHYIMLQRNLVYTGLTRARKLAFFIGSVKALGFAVGNNRSQKRQTKLRKRVQSLA